MAKLFEKFKGGDPNVRRKLNDMVEFLNRLQNLQGDDLISISESPGGVSVNLSMRKLLPKIPKAPRGTIFAVLVWQDGGTTDGTSIAECDRTYTVRTINATAIDTGGELLGEDMVPYRRRWVTDHYGPYNCPPATGAGVVGSGFRDYSGTFWLFDANETEKTTVCP